MTGPENPTPDPAGGQTPPAGGQTPPAGGQTPPAGGQAPPARLTRSRSDRVIGGVCGGIARRYDLDPTLVRVGAVAGVVLWGASAVLYLAALLLMPEEGTVEEPARLEGRNRALAAIGVVVLVLVGGPILLGLGFAAAGIVLPFALLVLCGLGVAWLVTGRKPAGAEPAQVAKLTLLGLGVLGLLFVLSLGSFWAAAAGGDEVLAGAVIVAGLALVASAFVRPLRWLILPALALAIPAAFVAAAGIDLDGGIGEKRYRPSAVADIRDHYEVGAGKLTIDLRGVDLPAGEQRLRVDVGMGKAEVLVPEDVCVSTEAELGAGGVQVFDRDTGGVDVDFEDARTPRGDVPRLVVEADVGLGAVEVAHEEGHRRRWNDPDREGNFACDAVA
jgi:phage shock protein PspC (stress-responsive transcriptional regulator)